MTYDEYLLLITPIINEIGKFNPILTIKLNMSILSYYNGNINSDLINDYIEELNNKTSTKIPSYKELLRNDKIKNFLQ